ncbi:LysR family transcriptional regulator [Acidovorax sp. sif1233]|uniref:LysR substrate-binding domain-containing protein n=1 Tax=Acidovorax sp. sif1233 TaxID=2854792 RepID=UPI001C447C80|nr:LysR substrate-binding domain-containing protein [Acidovorax sp. sif1233]MBV7455184.1 LysR family transcriptional regulator [Acidovorax sp. sif1233]
MSTPPPLDPETVQARLVSRLKVRHLVLLQQIEAHGTLTRVAHHMATSQPAITHALAELEAIFGAPLFERSPRGMVPTALGAVALARARTLLQDLGHWARDMEAASAGRAAHLQVGVIPFVPGRLLAAAIGQTRPRGLRATVSIHEGTSDHLLQRLRGHEFDCVIGRASAVLDMDGLVHEVLYHQEPRLIAHRRLSARLARKPLAWAELADLDWVLGARQTPMREQITDFFLRAGVVPPQPYVESLSSKVIGELVAASERAVSIVPADIAQELVRIAGVAIVPHRFGWTLPPITLFQRLRDAQHAEVAQFAQALRGAAAAFTAEQA